MLVFQLHLKLDSLTRYFNAMVKTEPFKVIDLFAGPGGLGEGFSSLLNSSNQRAFKIALSIEKDTEAHKTLELRSFFRHFPAGCAPEEYYAYLKKEIYLMFAQ